MAEPLVLLPGMMCDARVFTPQVRALSPRSTVVLAPITQGERIEEIASGLLDQLPPRFALVGQGMGGVVALELLRRAPDRISRIALLATQVLAELPAIAADREPQIIMAQSGKLGEAMQARMVSGFLAPGKGRGEVLTRAMEMAETLGGDTFVRQSRALQRRRDQQAVLRKCKVPALVLCGEHDMLCPVKRHAFMAEMIPYAKLTVLEDAGHWPSLEAPEATTAALRDWLHQPLVLQ